MKEREERVSAADVVLVICRSMSTTIWDHRGEEGSNNLVPAIETEEDTVGLDVE